MRLLVGMVLFTIIISTSAFSFDLYASAQALEDYPPTGEFITIDGLDIHTICIGTGDETIILFHGFAGGAIDMIPLMNELASEYQVCAFDRLGNDYSSPIPNGWSLREIQALHHNIIQNLTDAIPYVAGHSVGGGYVLSYAVLYPTRGIILLDGLSPNVADDVVNRLGSYNSLSLVAQLGLLRPIASSFVSPDYADNLYDNMLALRSRSNNIVGFADEGVVVKNGLTSDSLLDAVMMLDVPLLVFAAEQVDVPEGQAFHQSLLDLNTSYGTLSELIVIPDGKHYIIATHPSEIANSISNWINSQVN